MRQNGSSRHRHQANMNLPQGDSKVTFHVFEEWVDDDCSLSRMVAEVIRGEEWAWKRDFLTASENYRRDDADWLSGPKMADVISDFANRVRPQNASQDWIETAIDKNAGREPSLLAREWTVDRIECNATCGAGQFIQVTYVSPNAGHPFGQEMDRWWAMVDAGRFSPWFLHSGWALPHPRMPYFYGPRRSRSDCSQTSLSFFDDPLSALSHDEAYFETAAICIRHLGGEKDRLLKAFRWGWRERGHVEKPSPEEPDGDRVASDSLSDRFWQILKLEKSMYDLGRLA
jgi:hypothetical protein